MCGCPLWGHQPHGGFSMLLRARSTRRPLVALLALTCLASLLGFVAPASSAPVVNHDRVVSATPGNTPAVNNGEVDSIVQVGNTVVVGGTFTNVTGVGEAARTKNNVFAFDVGTGKLVPGFNPTVNGAVTELIPGPTAGTVYLGGSFTSVNGTTASHVTLLSTSTGLVVGNFRAASTNGVVNSMVQRGNRLYLGGNFSTAGGAAHNGLASLNATTGALDPYITSRVAVHHNNSGSGAQGAVGVRDIDINADGTRLVAIGNFKTVDGLSRDQLVLLTLGTTQTVTPTWATNGYAPLCFNFAFDTYVRGVSFSPDGSYFVVTATGGYVANTLCDTAARFETNASGTNIAPTWVDYTGGDTLWSNVVTEKAVYIGGHQRWLNNSLASDRAGAGSVPRPGLGALNTNTGMPLAWNPGRNPRGAAVYVMYATPTGLWLGSDTEYIGNHRYRRPRLAFFPLASGSPEASDATAGLPGTAYLGANQTPPLPKNTNDLRTTPVTTAGAGAASTVATGGVDWTTVRGSFVAGGKLWYGRSDGTFHSRTFTSGAFGPDVNVDPYHDPVWAGVDTGSNNTYDGVPPAIYGQFTGTTSNVTGMAYDAGKLYYVRNNDSNLYWRWFNTDSGIIGATQFTANGGRNWSGTGGMFATGGKLYFVSTATGNLSSIVLTPTGPTGLPTVVNSPLTGGIDWRARALFLTGTNQPPPNNPPTAAFSPSCTAFTCTFNGGASSDTDGTVSAWSWNFGDLTTSNGPTSSVSHTYTAPGTYTVSLTVTDNAGAVSQPVTAQVTVPVTQAPISFVASSTGTANSATPSVPVPTGVQAGDTMLLTASLSNATSATPPAGWTLVGDHSATATLRTLVWSRTATSAETSPVRVTLDAVHKAALAISAYRGVSAATITSDFNTDASTTSHTTPAVSTVPAGAWVVSLWADKGANTQWTAPGGSSLRAQAYSTASGAVSQAVADTNGPAVAPVAGATATTNATSTRGVNWSLVLSPQ